MTATSVLHIRVPNLPRKNLRRTGWKNTRQSSRCGANSSSQISVNPLIALQVGGGLLAGAAALAGGLYAYEKHKKGKAEEEVSPLLHFSDFPYSPSLKDQGPPPGYAPPDQKRPDEYREHGSGHSFSAGKVGALAAGAAAIGAGGYAYREHKKNKKGSGSDSDSDKVSSLLHFF